MTVLMKKLKVRTVRREQLSSLRFRGKCLGSLSQQSCKGSVKVMARRLSASLTILIRKARKV